MSQRMNGPIRLIRCKDGKCDKKQLEGTNMDSWNLQSSSWTHWFSDDPGGNSAICPSNKFVTRMQCRGDNCDEMRLECTKFASNSNYELYSSTKMTNWFSDEGAAVGQCGNDYALIGVYCRGGDCD